MTDDMEQITESYGAIQEPVEIDDMLLRIATLEDQIVQYKALAVHRVAKLKDEIGKLEAQVEQYRSAITSFMKENKEKSLNYPGVGNVKRREGKGTWEILDEDSLVKFLQSYLPEKNEVVKMEPKIVKKELNKVLDSLENSDKLPECVKRIPAEDVLSVTFDREDGNLLGKVKEMREIVAHPQSQVAMGDDLPENFK